MLSHAYAYGYGYAHDREHVRAHDLIHAAARADANALELDWVAFRTLKQV